MHLILFTAVIISLVALSICKKDEYIVRTTDNFNISSLPINFEVKGEFDFGPGFRGFVAKLSPLAINAIKKNNDIIGVTRSELVIPPPTAVNNNYIYKHQQNNVTWGLDILDGVLDHKYVYEGDGSGVDVYIVDSGIDVNHKEFEGRAKWGYPNDHQEDEMGHGTHVAGIIGSKTYGVAKKCTLIAVRVLGANGGYSADILTGLSYIIKSAKKSGKPSVVNMSMTSFTPQKDINDAAAAVLKSGIAFVTASGNQGADSCRVSPSMVPGIMSVAASDKDDVYWESSNSGPCCKVVAPGVDVLSTCIKSEGLVCEKTGTSMASPHVAGVLAQAYSTHKFEDVSAAFEYVLSKSRRDVLKGDLKKTPNIFIKAL
ncbi:subtilase-type proteinase [Acrasis kona]|uniref:Subtilase-type proteinase n=1 Tax=Acrasis kona TaxID=1008807 RepID=A0AAW2YR34_9EUKA